MAATPETGFLVIADLTGYTAYLSGSEIEHAPAIAGDLLETIVGRLEPPFRLAKFEGDAAFLFVEDGRADGSLLLVGSSGQASRTEAGAPRTGGNPRCRRRAVVHRRPAR